MSQILLPACGYMSTGTPVAHCDYPFSGMPSRPAVSALDGLVRQNLQKLLRKHYDNKPGRMYEKNKNAGIVLSRLQAFLNGESTAYISSLHSWVAAFQAYDVKAYHLFVPDLNVDDLPDVVPANKMRQFEKLRKQLLEDES